MRGIDMQVGDQSYPEGHTKVFLARKKMKEDREAHQVAAGKRASSNHGCCCLGLSIREKPPI